MKKNKLVLSMLCVCSVVSFNAFADDSLRFSGYARYGSHNAINAPDTEEQVGIKYVETDGGIGDSVGRLGNETYGGEIQLTKYLESSEGVEWDIGFMLEQYADWDLGIIKFYAGAKNIFESQPDLYVWGGRTHHMRYQTHLSNYFIVNTDGQGGGFKDLDLGLFDLDVGLVAKATGGGSSDSNGLAAFTSVFKDIDVADLFTVDLFANYGFDTAETTSDTHINAYQVGGMLKFNNDDWKNKISIRQSINNVNKVFTKAEDLTAFAIFAEGNYVFNDTFTIYYEAAYNSIKNDGDDASDDFITRDTAHVIIRPMVFWTAAHSTWLETGYDIVNYENDGEEDKAWKVTLSQNISIDGFAKSRPMVRAFITYGESDNNSEANKADVLAGGLMFESWW